MRRHHKLTTTAANLLASKRIAIAFCAAVAMVLGAMSVGATMHFYPNTPSTDDMPTSSAVSDLGTTQHANTTNVTSGSATNNSVSPTIITESKGLQIQNKLTPILVSPPKNQKDKKDSPLLVVPNIVSQTSLTLGPLSVSADLSNDSVQLNTTLTPPVTVSVPTTLQNILPSNNTSNTSGGTSNTGSTSPTGTSTDATNQGGTNNAPTNQTPSSPSLLSPLNSIINPTSNSTPNVATTTTPS